MANMTHDAAIARIIRVLYEFRIYLIVNRRSVRDNRVLSENKAPYLDATWDIRDLYGMLRKLNDGALKEMYRTCRDLAKKYDLPARNMPDSVTLYSPLYIRDAVFVEFKFSDGLSGGWGRNAPQEMMGFSDYFDTLTPGLNFNIHGTKFVLNGGQQVLRLWKGFYWACVGGEIGFYGLSREVSYEYMFNQFKEAVKRFLEIVGARAADEDVIGSLPPPPDKLKEKLVEYLLQAEELAPFIQSEARRNQLKQHLLASLVREAASSRAFLIAFFGLVPPPTAAALTAVTLAAAVAVTFTMQALTFMKFLIEVSADMERGLRENLLYPEEWGPSLTFRELSDGLGLAGTTIQVRYKHNDYLIAERREFQPRYWTNVFEVMGRAVVPEYFDSSINTRDHIYTKNYFFFRNSEFADRFCADIHRGLGEAREYFDNNKDNEQEAISDPIKLNDTTVVIYYGKIP